jgi:hypothetical protein
VSGPIPLAFFVQGRFAQECCSLLAFPAEYFGGFFGYRTWKWAWCFTGLTTDRRAETGALL